MPNMKTKGQRNLKLLGGQEKTDRQPDGRADSSIPPYNFVVRGYNYLFFKDILIEIFKIYTLMTCLGL
jgi:hypothetical protein